MKTDSRMMKNDSDQLGNRLAAVHSEHILHNRLNDSKKKLPRTMLERPSLICDV